MKNTERFSDRAEGYAKYRPDYPRELIDYIYGPLGAAAGSVFADVGAGTGKFTRFLLERGGMVFAVEPNAEMAGKARQSLGSYGGFRPVDGTAEQTTLADRSVDFVTCAQAFHWFDAVACRVEFGRILRPGGQVLIVYNRMDAEGSAFMREYERIHYAHSDASRVVDARKLDKSRLEDFFKDGVFETVRFRYCQLLDGPGLVGRAQSSSHAPRHGSARYDAMKAELDALFAAHARDGVVELQYQTELYCGAV